MRAGNQEGKFDFAGFELSITHPREDVQLGSRYKSWSSRKNLELEIWES